MDWNWGSIGQMLCGIGLFGGLLARRKVREYICTGIVATAAVTIWAVQQRDDQAYQHRTEAGQQSDRLIGRHEASDKAQTETGKKSTSPPGDPSHKSLDSFVDDIQQRCPLEFSMLATEAVLARSEIKFVKLTEGERQDIASRHVDPWGNRLRAVDVNGELWFATYGPDGKANTDDDFSIRVL